MMYHTNNDVAEPGMPPRTTDTTATEMTVKNCMQDAMDATSEKFAHETDKPAHAMDATSEKFAHKPYKPAHAMDASSDSTYRRRGSILYTYDEYYEEWRYTFMPERRVREPSGQSRPPDCADRRRRE